MLETSDGLLKTLPLEPRSVAEFYEEFTELLRSAESSNSRLDRAILKTDRIVI